MDNVTETLKRHAETGTPAERKISRYMLDHLQTLPNETAASIADRLDLSPMTVGRFLRSISYFGLEGMQSERRDRPTASRWQMAEPTDVLQQDLQSGTLQTEIVTEQIERLHGLRSMVDDRCFMDAIQAIVGAETIFVAACGNIGGIGQYFCDQLLYCRAQVRYLDGMHDTCLELFDQAGPGTLLVLVCCESAATRLKMLLKYAKQSNVRTLCISDQQCDWARENADSTLMLPASKSRAWHGAASLTAMIDMIVTSVAVLRGTDAVERTKRINSLRERFGEGSGR